MQRSMRPYCVAGLFVLIVGTALVMVHAWLVPVAMGGIGAVLLAAPTTALRRRLRRLGWLAPGLVVAACVAAVLLPMAVAGTLVARAALSLKHHVSAEALSPLQRLAEAALDRLARVGTWLDVDLDPQTLRDGLSEHLQGAVGLALGSVGELAAAAPQTLVGIFLALASLYFCLQDGHRLLVFVSEASPLSPARTASLFEAIHGAVRGVVFSSVVSGLVQAGLCLAAFLLFKIPGGFLWSALALLLSFLPMVGTTPVTFGAIAYLLGVDRLPAAAGMLAAAVIIGVSDNVVRPWAQGSASPMHPLVALVAIFGGLATLGTAGVFLGPIVLAVALWALDGLRAAHRDAP